jgi:D-sedoheptulose 7-phosphate isomerase
MSTENTGFLDRFAKTDEHDASALLSDLAASAAVGANESSRLSLSILEALGSELEWAAQAIAERFSAGACLYTFGNGASSADAACSAALFGRSPGGSSLPARCLVADEPLLSEIGKGVAYELTFARQLAAFAQATDIAMGYSTDGKSENVIRALQEAGHRGLLTVGFAGCDGGQMAARGALDHCFVVESQNVHRVQEAQAALSYHLWSTVQQRLAPDGGRPGTGRQHPAAGQELTGSREAR